MAVEHRRVAFVVKIHPVKVIDRRKILYGVLIQLIEKVLGNIGRIFIFAELRLDLFGKGAFDQLRVYSIAVEQTEVADLLFSGNIDIIDEMQIGRIRAAEADRADDQRQNAVITVY